MRIRISIPEQTLEVFSEQAGLLRCYRISTAKNGPGEKKGSNCTPLGRHLIRAKVGGDQPVNTVFVRRRPTGEIWSPQLAMENPGRDWILTRILWLSGKEVGRNRLGDVDTMRRFIYIHGSPDTAEMGKPGSIGCVRMHNADIVELFKLVPVYTCVDIVDFQVRVGAWRALKQQAEVVRTAVFIEEQGISAHEEWDEYDEKSEHAIALDACGNPLGTGRLLPDGRIGRMAVLAEARRQGVGGAILDRLLASAVRLGHKRVSLHAQMTAQPFYEKFGFCVSGAPFLEVGIPHVLMEKALA